MIGNMVFSASCRSQSAKNSDAAGCAALVPRVTRNVSYRDQPMETRLMTIACLESTASASAYASSALRKHDSVFILSHTSVWPVLEFRTASTAIIPSECMGLSLVKLFQSAGVPLENLPNRW